MDLSYKGGDVIIFPKTMTQMALVTNYVWVKPIVKFCPDKVLSAFFLADAFFMLDEMMEGKLLQNAQGNLSLEGKHLMACRHGAWAKKLVQYLRVLFRNERGGARNDKIKELK